MNVNTREIIEEEVLENMEEAKVREDLNSILESIPTLNYIEASNLKSNIVNEIENLNMMKETIDNINELNEDDLAKKIMAENELDDNAYKFDSEKFINEYNDTLSDLESVNDKLAEKLKEYDNEEKDTTFLTNQLIESIDKNLKRIEESDIINKDYEMKNLNTIKNIYMDRGNLEYLTHKASNAAAIKKWRKNLSNNQSVTIKKSIKIFTKHFNKVQLQYIEKYINEAFQGDEFASVLFLAHMANIISAETNSGKYVWVKVLFMNILDIQAGIFKYNDINAEEYENSIKGLYEFYK